MDLWATKTEQERQDEEADRLVRPAPKKKPPRHDRRRERVETDRDPDLEERDPDLSENYKDIGGSVARRWVLARRQDLIPVLNKQTRKPVLVSPETMKEQPGKYEELKEGDYRRQLAKPEGGAKPKSKKKKAPEETPEKKPDKPADKPKDDKVPKGEEDKEKAEKKPSVADKEGVGEPPRRETFDFEREAAHDYVKEVFPPGVAQQIIDQGTHPDDIREMVSAYKAAAAKPVKNPEKYAKQVREFFETDASRVKPPHQGVNASGEKVPWNQLTPEEKGSKENAEAYRKHQNEVVAASLAAQENLTKHLAQLDDKDQPQVPPKLAATLAYSMLKRPEPPSTVKVGGKEVAWEDLSEDQQAKAMNIVKEQTSKFLASQARTVGLESGKHYPITDKSVKQLLKGLGPSGREIARGYLEANDYHVAKKKFLRGSEGDAFSERDQPKDIVKGLDKAGGFFKERAQLYGAKAHSIASSFKVKVLSRLRALTPEKYEKVREEVDRKEAKEYESALSNWKKNKKGDKPIPPLRYEPDPSALQSKGDKLLKRLAEKPPKSEGLKPSPAPSTGFEQEDVQTKMPKSKGKKGPAERKKELIQNAKDPEAMKKKLKGLSGPELEKALAAIMDEEEGAKTASRVAKRFFSTYATSRSMDHSGGKQAVYHGIDPAQNHPEPSPGWNQPHLRDIGEDDYAVILAAARDWLTVPVLARPVEGLVRDTQLRAALDLGIKTSGYDRHLHPAQYNTLLARLSGVPETETLTTQASVNSSCVPTSGETMHPAHKIRKLAVEVAKTNPIAAFEMTEIADSMSTSKEASTSNKYEELKHLIIRTAGLDATARKHLMPVLQAIRNLDE